MSRACIYLVNDNPFYMLMVANSIGMLRQHNSTIPIKVLYITNTSQTAYDYISNMDRGIFEKLCEKYEAEIRYLPHEELPEDPDFFFSNKIHFSSLEENEILFIDGDTFICGDVEAIFDGYDSDFVGCENRWMGNDWNDNRYLGIKPFNGGVLLCKNDIHKSLFAELPSVCSELQNSDFPLAKWIQNGRMHNREEFGTSLLIDRKGISHDYFKKQDAYNILMLEEIGQIDQSKIFHCYAKQWPEAYKKVFYNTRRKSIERY